MPLTKEQLRAVCDEGLAMRDYHERFRAQLQNLFDQFLAGQDPRMLFELVADLLNQQRPHMEITFAERQRLGRTWTRSEWQKQYATMQRMAAKYGGNPDDVRMHPRPISDANKYTFIGLDPVEKAKAIVAAKARAEWMAERIAKAQDHIHEHSQITRGDTPVSGWDRNALTETEKRQLRPDGPEALPEGVEAIDLSDPQAMHEAIAKAVGETEEPGPK